MTDTSAPPRRGRPWIVAVPLMVVIVLGLCWSGLWFYAAAHAEGEIDAWMQREATFGRVWACKDRKLAGFPFRFEILCREPTLTTRGEGDPLRFTAARALVVAQVWAPNHIVAEFDSPAKMEDLATGQVFGLTWKLFQMSGVGTISGVPQRLSIAMDEPAVQMAPGDTARTILTARHLESHVRRTPPANGSVPDGVDFAFSVVDAMNPDLVQEGVGGPVNATLQGSISAVDNAQPMPLPERIRAWSAANGTLKVDVLRVTTPRAALTSTGALGIDPTGRLFGVVSIGFAGVDEFVKNLARNGVISSEMASVIGAVSLAGKPGDVAGRRGSTFNLTLKEGAVQIGKVPVGIIPPLF
ncbi:MAG: hypothetical protein B7X99_06330 [Rhizobiales bacterium 17-65-6]|mgnify:CR=1 FL=1|nr:MAG: hypothetical protein B7Y84_18625 [Azorhizobium sp. 32-67-21]OYZ99883.1 MAG: hypothetical protein B7X99_06330 [Rhizobiales bacterium 17-65-6]